MSYLLIRVGHMDGENPTGADNQQERPSSNSWLALIPQDLGHYLTGFADGEGSFNISFRPRKDHRLAWKVTMTLNISQRNVEVLEIFREVLKCGNLWRRHDGVWYFETRSLPRILERVIPFFRKSHQISQSSGLRNLLRGGRTDEPRSTSDSGRNHRHSEFAEADEPRRKAQVFRSDDSGFASLGGILRGHTPGIAGPAGIKRWSTPHGDMGNW